METRRSGQVCRHAVVGVLGLVPSLFPLHAFAQAGDQPPRGYNFDAATGSAGEVTVAGSSVQRARDENGSRGAARAPGRSAGSGPVLEHRYVPACPGNTPDSGLDAMCSSAILCPQNDEPDTLGTFTLMKHYQRQLDPSTGEPVPPGNWDLVESTCRGPEDPQVRAAQAPSLPELVIREWQSLRIPAATAVVQPPERTLVNFPTIVYTTTEGQEFPLTLIGRDVRLYAIPVTYRWDFGDGETLATKEPGAPYPAMRGIVKTCGSACHATC